MAYINQLTREINVKVAWLTTPAGLPAVASLFHALDPSLRRDWQEVALSSGRAQSFSFTPKALGEIRGMALRIHVFGAAVASLDDRVLLGRGADAVVVVDGVSRDGVDVSGVPVLEASSRTPPVETLKEATRAILVAIRGGGRGDARPAAPRPPDPRLRRVGPYAVLPPDGCQDVTVVDRPPLHRLDGIHLNGATLSFAVWVDRGNPDAVVDAVRQMASPWRAAENEAFSFDLEGVRFEGVVSRGIPDEPSLRFVETQAGVCGPDLLAFTILYGPPTGDDEGLRRLYRTLVAGAIVRALAEQPQRFAAAARSPG
ncbi:MAG: hypothetical protein R3B72_28675 [Polyangiaceae bacterium]